MTIILRFCVQINTVVYVGRVKISRIPLLPSLGHKTHYNRSSASGDTVHAACCGVMSTYYGRKFRVAHLFFTFLQHHPLIPGHNDVRWPVTLPWDIHNFI